VNPRVRPSPCPLGQGNMVSQKKKLCQCPLGHSPKGAHFLDTIFRESTCKHSLQGPLALYKWKGYPPFIKGLGVNPRVRPNPLGSFIKGFIKGIGPFQIQIRVNPRALGLGPCPRRDPHTTPLSYQGPFLLRGPFYLRPLPHTTPFLISIRGGDIKGLP
jgi:hypothetical protein